MVDGSSLRMNKKKCWFKNMIKWCVSSFKNIYIYQNNNKIIISTGETMIVILIQST